CVPSPLEDVTVVSKYGCKDLEDIQENYKGKLLGRGYWREVYLYKYKGEDIAVKTLRESQKPSRRNLERHRWEAAAMDALKDHPNIVHLRGICGCEMVTEYFPFAMDEVLFSKDLPVPFRMVVEMALGAARGLAALHGVEGGPVVHADLQPRQLLLNSEGVVKLNDLNRSRFMGRYPDRPDKPCPFRIAKANGVWRSPEEYAEE
ncbi:unnamed protein product, partial [Choristocarpus tenellus]